MKFSRKTGKDDETGAQGDPEAGKPAVDVSVSRSGRGKGRTRSSAPRRGYLDGQMLIAMPSMGDDRFSRSVIYVCAHSSDGAMGIIVNQPASNISFADLLVKLDVIPASDLIELPSSAGGVKVLKGGPVETERGFVLHSNDFYIENSPRRWISSRRSRAATAPPTRCSRSAMPAGRRASSKARSTRTAGCIARPTPSSSSARTTTPSTTRR
jgi:hypothetical protein